MSGFSQLELFTEPTSGREILRDYLSLRGLDYCASFVEPRRQQEILTLLDQHAWQNDLKRRVQHYGYRYDYKARRVDPSMFVGPLPEFAVDLGRQLVDVGLVPELPDQLIVNEYHPGQGITPHVDCEPCFKDSIVTVSLGSVYEMELTEIATGLTVALDLELGSVLVFSGIARYQWKHGIRPRKTDKGRPRGRRVSLTFRRVIIEGE